MKKLLASPIGLSLLASGILLERFGPEGDRIDFLTGFLFGLSLVFMIVHIFLTASKVSRS